MAYWSCCTKCNRWSVSAAPLNRLINKNCPYCGHQLVVDHQFKETSTIAGSQNNKEVPKENTSK